MPNLLPPMLGWQELRQLLIIKKEFGISPCKILSIVGVLVYLFKLS